MTWPSSGQPYAGRGTAIAFSANPTTNNLLSANFTLVSKFGTTNLLATGTKVKLTLFATGGTIITATYIGLVAASGNAYNFDGGQVQVKFGGAGSVTVGSSGQVTSDLTTFTIDKSKAVLVAFNVTSGGTVKQATNQSTTVIGYAKSGVSEAATTLKGASYTATSKIEYMVGTIEVS